MSDFEPTSFKVPKLSRALEEHDGWSDFYMAAWQEGGEITDHALDGQEPLGVTLLGTGETLTMYNNFCRAIAYTPVERIIAKIEETIPGSFRGALEFKPVELDTGSFSDETGKTRKNHLVMKLSLLALEQERKSATNAVDLLTGNHEPWKVINARVKLPIISPDRAATERLKQLFGELPTGLELKPGIIEPVQVQTKY